MKTESKKGDALDKFLEFILTRNTGKYLLLIVLFGFILRLIMVRNVSFLGDEMIHGVQALNMLGSKLIGTALESPTWYYLTNIFTSIFGVTIYGSRFTSLLYGTFNIFLVYLITSYLFNKKTGLISASFLAISVFSIRYTLIEMDTTLTFFILLSTYFLIRGTKENNLNFFYLSSATLGIGALVKTIALFFAPALFIYAFFGLDEKLKEKIKRILLYGLILLVFISPLIFYNFLLYQDKGYTDLYVGQYLNINIDAQKQVIGEEYLNPFSVNEIFKNSWTQIKNTFWGNDAPIFLLALAGIGLSLVYWRKKENYFLLGMILVGWFIQTGTNWLTTHYVPYSALFAIYAGYGTLSLIDKIKIKNYKKYLPVALLIIVLIINIFFVQSPLITHMKDSTGNKELREYVINEIPENTLVIADSRIYRGRIAWLLNDRIHIESGVLQKVLFDAHNQEVSTKQYEVYFIECAIDDCGWGTIRNDELNRSTEQMIASLASTGPPIKIIPSGGGYNEPEDSTHFKVYHGQISLPVDIEHTLLDYSWLLQPVRGKGSTYDRYAPQISKPSHKVSWFISYLILWLSIILALIAPIYVIYELVKQKTFNRR